MDAKNNYDQDRHRKPKCANLSKPDFHRHELSDHLKDESYEYAEHKHPKWLRKDSWFVRLLALLAIVCAFGVLLAVGYACTWLLQQITGALPPLATHIISGVIAFVLLLLVILAATLRQSLLHAREDFASPILQALDNISRGDFSVRIRDDGRTPLSEVIQSVNKLASDLGNLEVQRQEFVSNVSHEIQSPLTSIAGFAQLLRDVSLDDTERKHYLDIIQSECTRLSHLSDSLLKLTALDGDAPLNITSVDLEAQLQSAMLALEPQWQNKALDMVMDAKPITIQADSELLMQVWLNLLQNAIKFTPDGGSISVRVRAEDACAHTEDVEARQNQVLAQAKTSITVTIADTGIGIAAHDLPHIFERFYKADRSRDRASGGNGLGLALVKRIVELHHGHIEANSIVSSNDDSEAKGGTSFCVCFSI